MRNLQQKPPLGQELAKAAFFSVLPWLIGYPTLLLIKGDFLNGTLLVITGIMFLLAGLPALTAGLMTFVLLRHWKSELRRSIRLLIALGASLVGIVVTQSLGVLPRSGRISDEFGFFATVTAGILGYVFWVCWKFFPEADDTKRNTP